MTADIRSQDLGHPANPQPPRRGRFSLGDVITTRRLIVIILVVVVAVVVYTKRSGDHAPVVPQAAPTPQKVNRPFSPTSFWNSALPADVALDPNSSLLVQQFNNQWQTNYGAVGINNEEYSISVYTVAAGQPTKAVGISSSPNCNHTPGLVEQLSVVPVPDNAVLPTGLDHSLVIWQPSTNTDWEMWQAQRDEDGNWSACSGGRITDVSKSDGVFPFPFGVAASGLSYLAGAIKVSELKAGRIDHTIAVAIPHTLAGTQVTPANRDNGNSTADDAIPEGTRFRLDPTIDLTTLGLTPSGLIIARALQTYGMIVTDTSGAVVLAAENGGPYAAAGFGNPYATLFGSTPQYEILAGVPWSRLQAVSPSVSTANVG